MTDKPDWILEPYVPAAEIDTSRMSYLASGDIPLPVWDMSLVPGSYRASYVRSKFDWLDRKGLNYFSFGPIPSAHQAAPVVPTDRIAVFTTVWHNQQTDLPIQGSPPNSTRFNDPVIFVVESSEIVYRIESRVFRLGATNNEPLPPSCSPWRTFLVDPLPDSWYVWATVRYKDVGPTFGGDFPTISRRRFDNQVAYFMAEDGADTYVSDIDYEDVVISIERI